MLSEISLSNFKCFKEETVFPLANINLLTGVNGRGKSSVLQSLLIMRQSVDIDSYSRQVYLNGNCVDLGTVESIKNIETSRELPITIKYKGNIESIEKMFLQISYEFATDDLVKSNGVLIPISLSDRHLMFKEIKLQSNLNFRINGFNDCKNTFIFNLVENKLESDISFGLNLSHLMPSLWLHMTPRDKNYFQPQESIINFQKIHYIAADRIGPQNFYPYTNTSNFITVDKQGKYTPFILLKKKDKLVYDSLCLGQDAKTVEQQTEEWLNEILEGVKVKIKAKGETIDIQYNSGFKPSNVGFGYSYILPIIVSGLIAQKGEILIIENPEAHLHPKAQSKLTKFLAKVAACGIQVFIESHSEHILNALRVVSVHKDYAIKNTDISVLYFQNDENKPVLPIHINESGSIEFWPESFFDQEENDLSEIFRLTRKK